MNPVEFAAWTTGILALLGIVAAVVRMLMLGHRSLSRLEHIEKLASELAPNGGGSIKDAVHRIDNAVGDLNQKVDDNTTAIAEHSTRIARAEGRIEAIALVTSPTMLIEDEDGVIREAKAKGGN